MYLCPHGGGWFDCATPTVTQGLQSLPSIHAVAYVKQKSEVLTTNSKLETRGSCVLIEVLFLEQAFA